MIKPALARLLRREVCSTPSCDRWLAAWDLGTCRPCTDAGLIWRAMATDAKPMLTAHIKQGKRGEYWFSVTNGDTKIAQAMPPGYPSLEKARKTVHLLSWARIVTCDGDCGNDCHSPRPAMPSD